MSAINQFKKLHRDAINVITNIINEGSRMEDYPSWFIWVMSVMLLIAILLQPLAAAVRTVGQYITHSTGLFTLGISYLLGTTLGLVVLFISVKGFLILYVLLWVLKILSFRKSK